MKEQNKKNWQEFKDKNENEETQVDETQSEFDADSDAVEPELLEHGNFSELTEKLALAEEQAHENWEKSVRALAELDNVRRRSEREIANAHRYGVEKLINSLLPVMDSLEQALQLAEKEEDGAMREGLELTMKLFLDSLHKFEVQQIDPLNLPFDPQEHEAMSIMDIPGTEPNTVVTVFQKGYKLSDRVIRPARVIVSKK